MLNLFARSRPFSYESTALYDQNTFYAALDRDLSRCQSELVIREPIHYCKPHERAPAHFRKNAQA